MLNIVRSWVDRYFSDEQAVVLSVLLIVGFAVVVMWGDILAPVIASLIIAFILQGPVNMLTQRSVPRVLAVSLVFGAFLSIIFALFFAVLPKVYTQFEALLNDFPRILNVLRKHAEELQRNLPGMFRGDEINIAYAQISESSSKLVQWILSSSLSSLPVLVTVLIYVVVVPMLVFFRCGHGFFGRRSFRAKMDRASFCSIKAASLFL